LSRALPADDHQWISLLEAVFRASRSILTVQASEYDLPLEDFATTLLVAVVTPERVAVGQVGDGAVVARMADGSFRSITSGPPREYINETTFLTSPSCFEKVQYVVQPARADGLALLSDGLQMLALKMPLGIPHPAFFSPLLQLLAQARAPSQAEKQ